MTDVPERQTTREADGKKQGKWQFQRMKRANFGKLVIENEQIILYSKGRTHFPVFSISVTGSGDLSYGLLTGLTNDIIFTKGDIRPLESGVDTLGNATNRYKGIFLVDSPNVSSDIRNKENITELVYGLAEIERIIPIVFNRKGDNREQVGFSAQNVKEAIPEAVLDGDQLSITPDAVIAVLVNAVKELSMRVKELEDRVL